MANWGMGVKYLVTAGNTVPTKYWTDTGEVDENGNPILENEWIEMDSPKPYEQGRTFSAKEDGTWEDVTPVEDEMALMMENALNVCNAYIESIVADYNSANGIALAHIHACANYMNNPEYTHYQFCCDAWNWSVDVWEEARVIQAKVFSGEIAPPTEEEFIAMLPVYEGV